MPHPTTYIDEEKDSEIFKLSPSSAFSSPTLIDIKPKVEMDISDVKVDPTSETANLPKNVRSQAAQATRDVQNALDETVKKVREQSDRLHQAAIPYANKTRSFAERRPVLFTFLAMFTALSIIPVACFAGFILTSAAFILGVASVVICLSMFGAILLGATFLLPVLMFTTFLSFLALSFLLSLFLLHRLYIHISSTTTSSDEGLDINNLSSGVKSCLQETKGRLPVIPLNGGVGVHWKPPTSTSTPGDEGWVLGASGKADVGPIKAGLNFGFGSHGNSTFRDVDQAGVKGTGTVGLQERRSVSRDFRGTEQGQNDKSNSVGAKRPPSS